MTQLVINSGEATYVESGVNADVALYDAASFGVGSSAAPRQHGLLRFDLSALPSGILIVNAALTLTQIGIAQYGEIQTIYPCTRPWVQEEATNNHFAAGQAWTLTGGDFALSPTATIDPVDFPGFEGLPIDADVTALVAAASGELNVLIMRENDPKTPSDYVTWLGFGASGQEPTLTIDYTDAPDAQINSRMRLGMGVGL